MFNPLSEFEKIIPISPFYMKGLISFIDDKFAILWSDRRIPPLVTEQILRTYPIDADKVLTKCKKLIKKKKFTRPPIYKWSREILYLSFLVEHKQLSIQKIRLVTSKRTRKKYDGICIDNEYEITWNEAMTTTILTLKEILFIMNNHFNISLLITSKKRKHE